MINKKYVIKVNKFSLALFFSVPIIVSVAVLTMSAARDREAYLHFFTNPYIVTRFEPGFVSYGKILSLIGNAHFGVIFTILITYILLGISWQCLVSKPWLESFLMFNGIAFGVFQYFIGTAIRNGLSMAIAVYAAVKVLEGQKRYIILLFLSPFIHYGTTLFVALVLLTLITADVDRGLTRVLVVLLFLIVFLFFVPAYEFAVSVLKLPQSYYLDYVFGDLGQTERFRSFAMVLMAILMVWIFRIQDCSGRLLVMYAFPFLVYYLVTNITIFHRMLMPVLLFVIALFIETYASKIRAFWGRELWFLVLFGLNIISMLYAFNQYNLIKF